MGGVSVLDIIMVIWELDRRSNHLLASTPRLAKQVEENKALRSGNTVRSMVRTIPRGSMSMEYLPTFG